MTRKSNLSRIWLALCVLTIATLACEFATGPVQPVQPEQPTNPTNNNSQQTGNVSRAQLMSATVQIYGLKKQGNDLQPIYTGSGTILNSGGMILTNAHVASPVTVGYPADEEPDALGVSLVQAEDKPAVATYFAKVLAVDGYLDLAVIQIVSTLDGNNIDPNSLKLPFVPLGDSDQIHVGDHVSIFGFPGIGGDTITFTDGNISGFTSEDQLGDRAWIKTDATIAGGNSGGLAADDSGHIIGVPTQASAGGDRVTDCRVVQDTNGDGVINENDSCIPIGGFINGLRPVNLALPLINAAQAGKEYASPFRAPGMVTEDGGGQEAWSNFAWLDTSPSSEACENSGDTADSYPATALCIWTYFDYSGMTDGEQVREMWYHNDENVGDFTYSWEDGASGSIGTNLGNNGDPMPGGTYYAEFFAGADLHKIGQTSKVDVSGGGGGNAPTKPSGNGVTLYGLVYDADTQKGIANAEVYVLIEGIDYQAWKGSNFSDDKVLVWTKSDMNGNYVMPDVIQRNTPYTVVVYAEGYKITYGDGVTWVDSDPARYELNVDMVK